MQGSGVWWSVAGLTRACGVLPFPTFLTLYPCLFVMEKRQCEITIISFSRSICRGRLAALIEVTGKPYPSCLSCHSHPIRPCGAPSPRGEGCDTRIPSFKKRGEAVTSTLNLETNESKVKRSCEEMNPHFFPASFLAVYRKDDFLKANHTSLLKSPQVLKRARVARSWEIRLFLTASSSTMTMTLSR